MAVVCVGSPGWTSAAESPALAHPHPDTPGSRTFLGKYKSKVNLYLVGTLIGLIRACQCYFEFVYGCQDYTGCVTNRRGE